MESINVIDQSLGKERSKCESESVLKIIYVVGCGLGVHDGRNIELSDQAGKGALQFGAGSFLMKIGSEIKANAC